MITNRAYQQLLCCQKNIQVGRHPLVVEELPKGMLKLPIPSDRTISTATRNRNMHQLVTASGDIGPTDLRRTLFCGLTAYIGNTKLDAFDVISTHLYTEGTLVQSDEEAYNHPKMSLELRLNLQAFYRWCQHYVFVSDAIDEWSCQALSEYQYVATNDLLVEYGLTNFNGTLSPILDFQLEWKENFSCLAAHFTSDGIGGAHRPARWCVVYALQLLYSQLDNPVFLLQFLL